MQGVPQFLSPGLKVQDVLRQHQVLPVLGPTRGPQVRLEALLGRAGVKDCEPMPPGCLSAFFPEQKTAVGPEAKADAEVGAAPRDRSSRAGWRSAPTMGA